MSGQAATVRSDEPSVGLQNPAQAEYNLIALRVEFEPDSSRYSTGDGTFNADLFQGLQPTIDPFPHDEAYFQAHLDFLSKYVFEVSDSKTSVATWIVPEVVQVSGEMADYSPVGPDSDSPEEKAKLAELIAEAWTLADQQTSFSLPPNLDPATTAFVLFHAGTGRDVELTGTTLDRTPEDIPSLFFDESALDDLLGRPITFRGMKVTSTAVIPETESKRGVDPIFDEPFLFELSINGLVAASFFNYLGVPDLFDTATGQSAIGPFGLMDPLGIFAYGGLLPPEPSGWTKHYLGWSFPIDLSQFEPHTVSLGAGNMVAIAPISSSEYFLVQFRNRDPAEDGLNLVVEIDGNRVEQHFDYDSQGFTSTDQSAFKGVLVSADDYDWALPGGYDSSGDLRLGGILIWHVDDNRMRAGLPDNSVNADPKKRALDVEEADSGQDLGYPNSNPFAPELDRGTPFDFWFEGNPATAITETGEVTLYQNRFASDTYPNSNSNAGGPSFVVLENFSPFGWQMSFDYQVEENTWTQPIEALTNVRLDGDPSMDGSVSLVTLERGPAALPTLFVQGGEPPKGWFVGLRPDAGVSQIGRVLTKPAVTRTGIVSRHVGYLYQDDTDEVSFTIIPPGQGPPQVLYPMPLEVRFSRPSTPLIAVGNETAPVYYVGYDLGASGAVVRITSVGEMELIQTTEPVLSLAAVGGSRIAVVETSRTTIRSGAEVEREWTYPPLAGQVGQAAFGTDAEGLVGVIPLPDEGAFILLSDDGAAETWKSWTGKMSALPVLADIDLDGVLDVLFAAGTTLEAMTRGGAVVDGFPIDLPAPASGQPLVARWEDEQKPGIIIGLQDGYVHAYSVAGGTERPGFPVSAGGSGLTTPLLADSALYVVSEDGAVSGWILDGLESSTWSELFAGSVNSSYVDITESQPEVPQYSGLIDESETYNWPNPITEGLTRIRVKTRDRAEIRMTVIDLSGALVYDALLGTSPGGVPTEFEWKPDVGSGVYYAKIEATTAEGERATSLITVAVVR